MGKDAAGNPLFDASVTVLGEYVNHPVEEKEENASFPECRESGMDLTVLGAQMAARKPKLMS